MAFRWLIGHTYDLYRYFNAAHWPQAPAVITQSTISVYSQNIRYCSKPEIHYQYAFSGQMLTSTTWGFAFFNCSSPQFASQITGKYKTGDKVVAYVNPVSGIAVLEPDLTALWLVTLLGVFSGFLIWLVRPKKSK